MRFGLSLFLITLSIQPVIAQTTRAVLVDGPGPWRDDRWAFTAAQFRQLLSDAGYTVSTISPVDLATATGGHDVLLAVPSLESLPFATFKAIFKQLDAGGSLMASGGEPFRDPLYLAPSGQWLDAAAYQNAVGAPPPEGPFTPEPYETLSPSYKQYTNSAGLRVPIVRARSLSSMASNEGRYRVIGDLLNPAATLFFPQTSNATTFPFSAGPLIVWLPWAQLSDPLRTELVTALHASRHRLNFLNAGPDQIVWLPGEDATGAANILNAGTSPIQAVLQWSISSAAGVTPMPSVPLSVAGGALNQLPLDFGILPKGDYTATLRLMIGDEEVDRIDSPLRVLDPTSTRQPDQKIHVVNGAFYVGSRHVFLQGVNYWPRFMGGLSPYRFYSVSWLEPNNYDPDIVEADLTEIAALNFNLIDIQYVDFQDNWQQQARTLIDFLERCRRHGIWVRISLRASILNAAYTGLLNSKLGAYLEAAYLPGNDRVFAYELLWEPSVGTHSQGGQGGFVNGLLQYNTGRLVLDADWRAWVNDQYGSLANAEQIWGITAPRDATGQLTNPLDDQITTDGPWRIMVAAYRRFSDDYLGRNLGVFAREIRRTDPDTLLSYRNWTTMTAEHNLNTGYDIGAGAAHLDFVSPERYPELGWPGDQSLGLITAYSRYRTGGKPVQWAEFGSDIGPNYGTPASRATQASVCDSMMRLVADDGSDAATVWWWPGGLQTIDGSDYGIIDPDGTPRDCALTMAQWGATFAAKPPDNGTGTAPATLMVDRDADARGSYQLFQQWQGAYAQARQAGQSVVLVDQGTGTDTATMLVIQVGNAPYAGMGPLKFANAELGGIRIVCPNLDVTLENGSSVPIPSGAACQVTPTLVNTGEARWLPASASKGGVTLHTNLGDAPLSAAVPSQQRTAMGPVAVTMGQVSMSMTGRLRTQGSADFGEVLNLSLVPDSSGAGPCAISLSSNAPIAAPANGAAGSITITAASGCAWTNSSPQPWVRVTPTAGSGTSAANYTIDPNIGPSRQTTVVIANRSFTVLQAGTPATALLPAPTLSATSLNFGSQNVGAASAGQTVTVTNTGAAALNLTGFAIGGTNGLDFAQTNMCGPSVAPAASCAIRIIFTPSAPGSRTASLFIAGNISGTPAVTLSGMGTATGPIPTIQAIVDSWGYSAGIAPGLWVTIAGTNMAGAPQTWNLTGTQQLPTTLGGVTVLFNGTPAALLYVSATQINALVPASVSPGPTQVVVQTNGLTSTPFPIAAKATQPAAYAPPNADGSSFFITAALQGTAILVGNSATDPRVVRAAYPGDVLDLYMIGLGATADPSKFITDQPFTGAFPVSAKVTATVGGENAPVQFAGLISPGLYLLRVSIPADLAAGPQPVQVSTGDAVTRASLLLRFATPPPNLLRNGSALASAVRTWQSGFALQQGEVYRLQFQAKADAPGTLRVQVNPNGGSENYGLSGAIPIGSDWQQYVVYFTATASDPAAQLGFNFGDQTGNAWLNAVTLQGIR